MKESSELACFMAHWITTELKLEEGIINMGLQTIITGMQTFRLKTQIQNKIAVLKTAVLKKKSLKTLKIVTWEIKQRKLDRHIYHLKDPSGNLYSTSEDILKILTTFYESLYSTRNLKTGFIHWLFELLWLYLKTFRLTSKMFRKDFTISKILETVRTLKDDCSWSWWTPHRIL